MKINAKTYFDRAHELMIRQVVAFCLAVGNISVTQSVVALYNLITNVLQTNLATITTLRGLITSPITGYYAQKKALKGAIADMSVSILQAVYSYANATSNPTLASQMKISRSAMMKMEYLTFTGYVQNAINIVTPIIGSLSDYNVTGAGLTALQSMVDELNGSITDPKFNIQFRKTVNQQIQNLLRDCMVTLYTQTDGLVTQFKLTNTPYYNNYRNSRRLNPTHMSTQLRLWVLNQLEQPVTSGEVFIVGTDRSAALDLNGYALVDHIPFGIHNFTLTTPSGTNTYGPFDFKKGKSLTLHVQISTSSSAKPIVTVTEEEVVETASTVATEATAKK